MKKKSSKLFTDPVVDEVRAIRAKLWKQGGGTLEGYMALMHKLAAERAASKPRAIKSKKPTRRRAA